MSRPHVVIYLISALYLHVNEERSESKTDAHQLWSTPSAKIQSQFPKGQTVEQIFGSASATAHSSFRQVRIQGADEEVGLTVDAFSLRHVRKSDFLESRDRKLRSEISRGNRDFVIMISRYFPVFPGQNG